MAKKYKTRCLDCKTRLYVDNKGTVARCYDCECKFHGVEAICYFPELPHKGYFTGLKDISPGRIK